MSDDYTRWDSIKQTQAYLLDEAEKISLVFRSSNEVSKETIRTTVLATTSISSSSPSTFVNDKRSSFLDLPDAFTTHLHPEIKVYKTYVDDDGTEHDYLLPMGEYLGRMVNGDGTEVETTRGVVVKSVEFTRLGGNPAEIDTNIKFNIKLFSQDITTFFVKNETSPVIPYTPQASQELVSAQVEYEDAFALIEAAAEPGSGVSQGRKDLYDERLVTAANRVDELAKSESDIGPNGERRTAWIDLIKINPGQPLNDGNNDTALVTSENQVRIKVEIGYATPNTKPINYNGNDWQDWAEVIGNQKEVFYLSLFKHQFDFRGYDGVDLSIDFIASANATKLSPEADLFSNPEIEEQLNSLRSILRNKERELKLSSEQEEATEATTQCEEELHESIENIETKIREINSKNKLRLLNQIYLQGELSSGPHSNGKKVHASRLFTRSYDTPNSDSKIKSRQRNATFHLPANIQAGSNLSLTEGHGAMMNLSVTDQDFAENSDEAEVGTTEFTAGSKTSSHFIFLGDIIDAAFELLVSTETAKVTTRFRVTSLNHFGMGNTSHSYDRQFHPPIDFGPVASRNARLESVLRQFGGLIGGWVSYTSPNIITEERSIPIRDIPISLDIFRAWWINGFVQSGKNTLGIKDFIVQLMKFVETDVFKNIPIEYGLNDDKIETPKFIVNSAMVKYGFLPEVYRYAIQDASVSRNVTRIEETRKKRVSNELLRTAESGVLGGSSIVMFIEQSDNNPRWNGLTATITFGETNKGILKGVNFQREDIPGHAEARLFSDRTSVAGNIALREKYNTKLDLIGTTSLAPGSLFYLDPLPLDLGWSQTERTSFARQLGLGGMYRVVNLTSAINFDSSKSTWETTVNTKWESFGDGQNGVTAVAQVEADAGVCAEREAGEIDVIEEARRGADDPRFYERQAEEQSSAFYVDPAEGQRAEDVVPTAPGASVMAPAE